MDPHDAPAITFEPSTLMTRMGIIVTVLTADLVVATMPVDGNRQTGGYLHGGASAALAETVGSLGAFAGAPEGHVALGVDLNITHHRSVADGTVTATARPLYRGSSLASYAVDIRDNSDELIASARVTSAIRARR